MTGPAEATPDERRQYELACVSELKRYFEREGVPLWNGRRPAQLTLRGDYPDTELVVHFVDADGDSGSEAFDLWHEDPPYNLGDPEEAEHMAFLIGINVAGM